MCRVWLQKVSLYNLCEWIGTPNPKKTAPGHRPVKNRNSEKPAVISCKRRSYRTEYGEGCEGGAGPKGPIPLGVTAHRHFLRAFFFPEVLPHGIRTHSPLPFRRCCSWRAPDCYWHRVPNTIIPMCLCTGTGIRARSTSASQCCGPTGQDIIPKRAPAESASTGGAQRRSFPQREKPSLDS